VFETIESGTAITAAERTDTGAMGASARIVIRADSQKAHRCAQHIVDQVAQRRVSRGLAGAVALAESFHLNDGAAYHLIVHLNMPHAGYLTKLCLMRPKYPELRNVGRLA
jgi:hypothetical protein